MIKRIFKQPYLLNFIFQRLFRINSSASFSVHFTSQVYNGENIRVGKKTRKYLANAGNAYYHGLNGIDIGDGTIIAPGVKIVSTNHNLDDYSKLDIGDKYKIVIGERCWLGANSVVLAGTVLGDGVVVASGAVVTKSFPSNCIIGGVPAEIIKTLKTPISQSSSTERI